MKNKMIDLHNTLFEQLEHLADRDITGEKLAEEFKRADSMVKIAGVIVSNASLMVSYGKAESANELEELEVFEKKPKQLIVGR